MNELNRLHTPRFAEVGDLPDHESTHVVACLCAVYSGIWGVACLYAVRVPYARLQCANEQQALRQGCTTQPAATGT